MRKARFALATYLIAAASSLAVPAATIAQPETTQPQNGVHRVGVHRVAQLAQGGREAAFEGLSSHERKMAAQVPNCQVIERDNIILLCPAGMTVARVPQSSVSNPEQLADWLEQAYRLMREWMFHDPNAAYQQKNGERHRLAFVWNGKRHFIFGGVKRPYIALQHPPSDANWFGYISHEIGHDFLHIHPDFRGRLTGWNEAACNYARYHLVQAMGMTEEARRWEEGMFRAPITGRNARPFVELERRSGWDGPGEFWRNIKGQDINILFATLYNGAIAEPGPPTEDATEALVAAWDFEASDPLADKAPAGEVADDLIVLRHAKVENGIARLPAAAALQATSSPDLEITGEMTLWARVRVRGTGPSILSLIDKRLFRNPEARSYGLLLIPTGKNDGWGLGGQISGTGTRDMSLTVTQGSPAIPVDEWREIAMVARRVGGFLSVSWLASTNEGGPDTEYIVVNGPASVASLGSIFRASQPLLIGNDSALRAKAATLEFDEVRVYNRALTADELVSIVPGELSQHGGEGQ